MSAPLSIILPTLNSAQVLPDCAEALLPGLGAGLIAELLVVDGGSADATRAMAEALGARFIAGPASRRERVAAGVREARGDWLLILAPEARLTPAWVDAVEHHLARRPDRAARFRLKVRADGIAPALVSTVLALAPRPPDARGLCVRRRDWPPRQRALTLAATAELSAAPFLDAGWLRHTLRLLRAD